MGLNSLLLEKGVDKCYYVQQFHIWLCFTYHFIPKSTIFTTIYFLTPLGHQIRHF